MGDLVKPVVDSSSILEIVRALREDVVRHEQLLEQLTVFLEQSDWSCRDSKRCRLSSGWLPTGIRERMSHLNLNVRRIDVVQGKSQDIITRLRSSALCNFYKSYLKCYPSVRGLVGWIWRNAFPLYSRFAAHISCRHDKRWRPLIKLSEFVKTRSVQCIKVLAAESVETPAPNAFPKSDRDCLISPHTHYDFPDIYIAAISDGEIFGGTNLVFTESEVLYHDLYDFQRDYTSEERHGRALIDPEARRIRWLLSDENGMRLPMAAVFVDACAHNYAHWLTEVLPRIAVFCSQERFKDTPVVVNDGLHENILESLFMIVGPEREVIMLPIGRSLRVDTLYVTSVAGYVPYERRSKTTFGHSHGMFSPSAFQLIRNKVALSAEIFAYQEWPEKIYIRRNSGARKLINYVEVEGRFITDGYEVLEPEKLTFFEQVQLFNHAKIIVGSSGAAFANIIFCPPEANINIMIAEFQNTSYWYWQNIACATGNEVRYILGRPKHGDELNIHADFHVDRETFENILV
jgi:capsular polysaccharide biosynthesis protein